MSGNSALWQEPEGQALLLSALLVLGWAQYAPDLPRAGCAIRSWDPGDLPRLRSLPLGQN